MATDSTALLSDIVSSWQSYIPFQNLGMIACPQDERHPPTLHEIKENVFTKMGGCCYHNNIGCYLILCAVGFDVSLVASDVGMRNNHPLSIVHNLSYSGSHHVVDVGTGGYPTFLPIPLDFKKESSEYHQSYLRYKFILEGDTITRMHNADSNPSAGAWFEDTTVDGWYPYTIIHHDTPVEISYFDETMKKLFTQVLPSVPLLTSPMATYFPNGRFVSIKNTTLLVENDQGKVEKLYLKSRADILAAYARFFPQLPPELILTALADGNVKLNFDK
ncbi:uncharacterized protein [Diadema setosum]|uniref:uncharacterized protein n=1 Tax=Diadema setosum TaxID=31175 RepID=UPI003B3A11C1